MKCPNCNAKIELLSRQEKSAWYVRTCGECGKKFCLDGWERFMTNFAILAIGLGLATFLDFIPLVAIAVVLASIAVIIPRMFVLKPFSDQK